MTTEMKAIDLLEETMLGALPLLLGIYLKAGIIWILEQFLNRRKSVRPLPECLG